MRLIEGIVVAERFRLVRKLGQGGMGSVWLAQHLGLGIPCAVKFIHGDATESAEIRVRFEREAKAAAQLRSPNVVQVLDSGVYDGTPYIAMELLEGEDLGQRLKRVGRLSPHETASIVSQVARALTKAHAAGLVHRDLKPDNIFLVRDDDREIAKVLDFGVAKDSTHIGDGSTKTGALVGTPYYMSPEQARGLRQIDHRADLWSLAVVAYQCLMGSLPFMSEALGDLLVQIIVNPLPVPSQVLPGVPASFDAWWARASQRDPALRFQSARELADGLALALGVSQVPGGLGVSAPGTASGLAYAPPAPQLSTTGGRTTGGVVAPSAPKSSGGAAAALAIGAVVLLGAAGAGAWLLLRSRGAPPVVEPAPAASAIAEADPVASAEPSAATAPGAEPTASAEPAATAAPAESAEPATSAAPAPSALPASPPRTTKPVAPKPKRRDFGF